LTLEGCHFPCEMGSLFRWAPVLSMTTLNGSLRGRRAGNKKIAAAMAIPPPDAAT
jgi:hypothetical protein